jgi:cellulase
MIAGNGWWYFTLPSCIAPGQYLMRVELIALHSAYSVGGAQFYISCANIEITGSGTTSPSSTVSFPGAYTANDPGITLNIYGTGGVPDNGGKAYPIPGPAVMTCGAGSGGGTTAAPTTLKASTTSTNPPATTTAASGAPLYGQCGGSGWTGATTCAQGTCTKSNDYYSE